MPRDFVRERERVDGVAALLGKDRFHIVRREAHVRDLYKFRAACSILRDASVRDAYGNRTAPCRNAREPREAVHRVALHREGQGSLFDDDQQDEAEHRTDEPARERQGHRSSNEMRGGVADGRADAEPEHADEGADTAFKKRRRSPYAKSLRIHSRHAGPRG